MKKLFLVVIIQLFLQIPAIAQSGIVSGPMLGYVEHQEALIWLEVNNKVRSIEIEFQEKDKPESRKKTTYKNKLEQDFNPVKIVLTGLMFNKSYEYRIILDGKELSSDFPYKFNTKKVWARWSKDEPGDYSFLFGSCTYLNETPFDRPGKPYGQDPSILKTMAETPADFMVWTGDNIYLREADWTSRYGIYRRNSYNRSQQEIQKVLQVRPNYAIWDDHDFGPNDSNGSFDMKEETLDAFKDYWGNKTYGEADNPGIYGRVNYLDTELFLLDDRYHRSANQLPDSVNGQPNPDKHFLGKQQLEWLKNALISSDYNIKFIVCGSQVNNKMADKECFSKYSYEYNELMKFIVENKIRGVLFLSGDRHFTELLKLEQQNFYPLYEFTNSPISSGVYTGVVNTAEAGNPMRVEGTLLTENNFGKVSISGPVADRTITFESINGKGEVKWKQQIKLNDLKVQSKK
jgi:alkaline phosphatase D